MGGCPDEPCQATSSSRDLNDYLEIINRKGLPGKDKTDLCLQVQDPVTATVQYIRASVVGLSGTGGGAAYIAAKHGVVGLARQMAVVYSKRGTPSWSMAAGGPSKGIKCGVWAVAGRSVYPAQKQDGRHPALVLPLGWA